ncbi:inositol polyphosphate 5-phosphatase K-like isoform X2 [Bombus pyrosoma]|uniref:inositol polyphosphate 5-phosphatase K-like isoform X2 n=1 Tax=Bombus pyrosoma TaxID=396416 RepID=UPI001CB9C50E|nr:inositol polyphosphate 5-phosphatase K-like isoform X2 [Bombus pyrosoma]
MADTLKYLRIYFVTWNVATKYPEEDLHELLDVNQINESKTLPDLYIVGLQEVKAQPQNMVMDIFFDDPWTKSFRDTLKKYDYVKIRTQRLQGLVLSIFCVRKHIMHLRLIEAQYTRTGCGGMWGNKGAVSIRLNMHGINMCIVNAHLTPHDHLLTDRIMDYNAILRSQSFNSPYTSKISLHDYVFWIGDLNFRLHGEDLTATEIDVLVRKNELKSLLTRDQLKMVMRKREAFSEFNENPITFPPTYKYEFASQEFDLKRRPSWTDRILYRVNPDIYDDVKLNAIQRSYKSHSNYVQSDHKPVTGEFDIVIRPNVEKYGVEFQLVSSWFIGEENSVSYRLLGEVIPISGDWVGLFHSEFSGLDEYIVYEYVDRVPLQPHSIERISFSDTALRAPGMYRLVYVAQRENLLGILGISPPFPGHHRPA